MPTDAELLKGLGSGAPPSNEAIGGTILALSQSEGTCTYEFRPGQMVLNAAGFAVHTHPALHGLPGNGVRQLLRCYPSP